VKLALHIVNGLYAFGEFIFDATLDEPKVTFRLKHEDGDTLCKRVLKRSELIRPARKEAGND
jgi:hypothetical protein